MITDTIKFEVFVTLIRNDIRNLKFGVPYLDTLFFMFDDGYCAINIRNSRFLISIIEYFGSENLHMKL